jgi:hypothetical protein
MGKLTEAIGRYLRARKYEYREVWWAFDKFLIKNVYIPFNTFLYTIFLIGPITELYEYVTDWYIRLFAEHKYSRVYTVYYLLFIFLFLYFVVIYFYFDQFLFQSVKDTTRMEY